MNNIDKTFGKLLIANMIVVLLLLLFVFYYHDYFIIILLGDITVIKERITK